MFFFSFIFNRPCITDSDCSHGQTIDSLFCSNNVCTKLIPANQPCLLPSDCASYFYYGPIACSVPCKPDIKCSLALYNLYGKNAQSVYCCKEIPLKRECKGYRPSLLSGCGANIQCLKNEYDIFTCENKRDNNSFGVFLSVMGNILISFGINLQKLSFTQNSIPLNNFVVSTFYSGVFIYSVGKIFGFSSYIFGNQSLLTSIGSIGLIANCIFAPLLNHEIFTEKDFFGILCLFIGSTTIVLNSKRTVKAYSLCELLNLYKNLSTKIYFSGLIIFIVLLYIFIKFVEVNSEINIPNESFRFLRSSFYFENTNFMVLLYVLLAAAIASFTTLSAKSFGELMDISLQGDNQFFFKVSYIFLVLIIVFTFLQIFWLARALKFFDALLVLPLFHSMWNVLSFMTAGIYFQDFKILGFHEFRNIIIGLVFILIGSGILMTRIFNRTVVNVTESDVEISNRRND